MLWISLDSAHYIALPTGLHQLQVARFCEVETSEEAGKGVRSGNWCIRLTNHDVYVAQRIRHQCGYRGVEADEAPSSVSAPR